MKPVTSLFFALAALCLLLPTQATAQEDGGYPAIITGDSIEVRSGAGRAYYVVGELEDGQHVRVVEVLFDATWYKIAVPDGMYSYVRSAFIDAQGDGSVGVVNTDRTEFNAASLRGPGESYRVQGTFSEGDRVEIIAQEGSYYKILAPTDAYVFVPAGSLRRATEDDMVPAPPADDENTDEPVVEVEDPADATAEEGNAGETELTEEERLALEAALDGPPADDNTGEDETPIDPVVEAEQTTDPEVMEEGVEGGPEVAVEDGGEAVEPVDVEGDPEADPDAVAVAEAEGDAGTGLPTAPDVEVSTPARSDALIAMEMELLPYFSSPIEERPLDHMEAQYTELLETGDLPRVDQQIVGVRLRTIARQREILAAMQRVEAARSAREPRTEIPDVESLPRMPVEYQAVGLLQVSSVYDGQSLPRMYRLVDPSGRTVAYVAPTPMIDESDLLDTLVGVVGSSSYDPALKLRIITPEQLDALAAE